MPAPPSSEPVQRGVRSGGLESKVPERPHGSDGSWISRQVQAMASAWASGQRITAEELLQRHPELNTEDAIRLVYEEVCLRREAGQDVPTAEVVSRFPQWKDELEVLLGCDRLLRPLSRTAILPEVG